MGTIIKIAIGVLGCLAAKKVYDSWKDRGFRDGVGEDILDLVRRVSGTGETDEERQWR